MRLSRYLSIDATCAPVQFNILHKGSRHQTRPTEEKLTSNHGVPRWLACRQSLRLACFTYMHKMIQCTAVQVVAKMQTLAVLTSDLDLQTATTHMRLSKTTISV